MGLTGPYGVSPAINQITASGDDHSAARSSESHASSQRERRFALYAEFGLMYRVMVLLDLLIGMRCGELVLRQNVKRPIVGCFHRPRVMMSGQLVRVSGGLERPIVSRSWHSGHRSSLAGC
jgi:hypothetical protein